MPTPAQPAKIYRGCDVTQTDAGLWEWIDEEGRVHTGKVNTKGGYVTDHQAFDAIDAYKRAQRAGA